MDVCQAFGRKNGYRCERLDAYPGNPAAISLYEKRFKPPGLTRYVVYALSHRPPELRTTT